jgi:hypothetical protein
MMTYNPQKHAGIICAAGQDYIIEDAVSAALHELPNDIRRAIQESTRIAIDLLQRSRDGTILHYAGTEEQRQQTIEAYERGIALLQIEE